MTFEEALQAIKEGKKVGNKGWSSSVYLKKYFDRVVNQDGKTMNLTITSMLSDDWEEYKEPVLDEEEKKYLSAVIKPFKDMVYSICKTRYNNCSQSICIKVKKYYWDDDWYDDEKYEEGEEYEYIKLPCFIENTMYVNMEVGKEYSLEDLGL